MVKSADREVKIGVQRPGAVDGIDLGPLISELSVEPHELVRNFSDEYHPDGEIEISIQRTHEWEYVLFIFVSGGTTFAAAVMAALGDRLGNWIVDQASGTSHGDKEIEISTEAGPSVTVPIDELKESSDEVTIALEDGSKSQGKVTIKIP